MITNCTQHCSLFSIPSVWMKQDFPNISKITIARNIFQWNIFNKINAARKNIFLVPWHFPFPFSNCRTSCTNISVPNNSPSNRETIDEPEDTNDRKDKAMTYPRDWRRSIAQSGNVCPLWGRRWTFPFWNVGERESARSSEQWKQRRNERTKPLVTLDARSKFLWLETCVH